ncbi:hypothetical protein L1887_33704 [Cichorium endivia]|nr:hypothetical protein L1887_33704 [Cichorium endivia]
MTLDSGTMKGGYSGGLESLRSQQREKRQLVALREEVPGGCSDGQVSEVLKTPSELRGDWAIAWHAIVVQGEYGRGTSSASCTPFVACVCQSYAGCRLHGFAGRCLWEWDPSGVSASAAGQPW